MSIKGSITVRKTSKAKEVSAMIKVVTRFKDVTIPNV